MHNGVNNVIEIVTGTDQKQEPMLHRLIVVLFFGQLTSGHLLENTATDQHTVTLFHPHGHMSGIAATAATPTRGRLNVLLFFCCRGGSRLIVFFTHKNCMAILAMQQVPHGITTHHSSIATTTNNAG